MTKRRQSISMAVLRSPEQETLLDEGYYLHSVLPPSHIGSIPVGVFIYTWTDEDIKEQLEHEKPQALPGNNFSYP